MLEERLSIKIVPESIQRRSDLERRIYQPIKKVAFAAKSCTAELQTREEESGTNEHIVPYDCAMKWSRQTAIPLSTACSLEDNIGGSKSDTDERHGSKDLSPSSDGGGDGDSNSIEYTPSDHKGPGLPSSGAFQCMLTLQRAICDRPTDSSISEDYFSSHLLAWVQKSIAEKVIKTTEASITSWRPHSSLR